jgi:hypothetical protein
MQVELVAVDRVNSEFSIDNRPRALISGLYTMKQSPLRAPGFCIAVSAFWQLRSGRVGRKTGSIDAAI